MKTFLTIAGLFGVLAAAAVWGLWVWLSLENVEISLHGFAAMALGIVFTLGLGIGLMSLVFFSSRHGYEDAVDEEARRLARRFDHSPE